jgi:hypothetical protein
MKNYNNITKTEECAEDSSSSRIRKSRKIALTLATHGSLKGCRLITADNAN